MTSCTTNSLIITLNALLVGFFLIGELRLRALERSHERDMRYVRRIFRKLVEERDALRAALGQGPYRS